MSAPPLRGLLLCWLAALLGLSGLAGCGYSTRLAVDQGIDSVGIEIFGNDTFERDVEQELHAELSRAVRNLVDADLTAPGQADVVIRGKLTRYTRRGGIRSPDNELLQTGIIIWADVELVERVTGEVLVGPMEVAVDLGFSLTGTGMESEARRRGLVNLSERIALDLFTANALRTREEAVETASKKDVNQ